VLLLAIPFLVHKRFTLTGRFKSQMCERFWSSAEHTGQAVACCQKRILPKQKLLNLYMICSNAVKCFWVIIICVHCIGTGSQLVFINRPFEIFRIECFWSIA